jgi:hypothetical protein
MLARDQEQSNFMGTEDRSSPSITIPRNEIPLVVHYVKFPENRVAAIAVSVFIYFHIMLFYHGADI